METKSYNKFAYIYLPIQQAKNKALIHRRANKMFRKINQNNQLILKCECCGRLVGQDSDADSFCYDMIQQTRFLGSGVSLFFIFQQNMMIVLILLLVLVGIQSVSSNISSQNCSWKDSVCNNWYSIFGIENKIKDKHNNEIQIYLILFFVLIWMFINQILLYRIRKTIYEIDSDTLTPSDFAIMISNLPQQYKQIDIRQYIYNKVLQIKELSKSNSLHQFFHDILEQTNQLDVSKIVRPFKLDQFFILEDNQQKLFKSFIQNTDLYKFQRQIPKVDQKFTTSVIVIFQYQRSKDAFLYPIHNNLCSKNINKIKQNQLEIFRSPQPQDLIIRNVGIPSLTIVKRKFITYFLGFLCLLIGGSLQYVFAIWQKSQQTSQQQFKISMISTIIVTLINYIIPKLMIQATKKQKNYTFSLQNQSLTWKICIFQFLNGGIFYTLCYTLAINSNADSSENFKKTILKNFSIKITVFMLINAIVDPLLQIITGKLQFPNCLSRYLFQNRWIKLNQKQSNKIYQYNDCQIPNKYAYIIKTCCLTSFYTPFAPIVILFSLFGLIFYYFVCKYLFRNNYNTTLIRSGDVNDAAMRLTFYLPFTLCLGQLCVFYYIGSIQISLSLSARLILYLSLCISGIFGIMPWNKLNQLFSNLKIKTNQLLQNAKQDFQIDYQNVLIKPFLQNNNIVPIDLILKKGMHKPFKAKKISLPKKKIKNDAVLSLNRLIYNKRF